MCGFVGFVAATNEIATHLGSSCLEQVSNPLTQRGPDAYGFAISGRIGLAHRRLSVIDLSDAGAQPMASRTGRYLIAFNGEIYNYLELRSELSGSWTGHSDTEVVLEAIEIWGIEKALKKMSGMFSLALWDSLEESLVLAQDRIGEKPLCYGWAGESFIFGSTFHALRKFEHFDSSISLDVLALYFRQLYIPPPFSIYSAYRTMKPGCYLRLDKDCLSKPGTLPQPVPYWSLLDVAISGKQNPFRGTYEDAVSDLDAILGSAVKQQMVSDVPLGAFLSGGIDSSTIVALMQQHSNQPVKTYTIGFEDKAYDESRFADKVAEHLGVDHKTIVMHPSDASEIIPKLPALYDQPFGDSSQIPTYFVSKFAREEVTVALTGDGGDELFAGYNRHVKMLQIDEKWGSKPRLMKSVLGKGIQVTPSWSYEWFLRKFKPGILSDQVKKFGLLMNLDGMESMYLALTEAWETNTGIVRNHLPPDCIATKDSEWPKELSPFEQVLWAETMVSLPGDMLVKVDRASMGVSLETRVPFLNPKVIEFAWSLPKEYKVSNGKGKRVLRSVLDKHVPTALTDRRKAGFGVPVDEWMKGPLRDWCETLLSEKMLDSFGYLNTKVIRQMWNEHVSGKMKHTGRLWGVLMFISWHLDQIH